MFRLLLAAVYASLVCSKTVSYDFSIGWVTAAPDGYARPVMGVNGQWPIPTIEADMGDTIVVTAHNNLGNETTSLHFHGMFQKGSGIYDGATAITACPIQPGDSYTYSFVANPAGTHWYHSHDKGQYPDGLRGKMIIHDRNWENSLGIDSQIYLSMSDWYHRQMPDIIKDYMSPSNTNGDLPSPDTILVNDTRSAPQFKFGAGKKYLIRISNIGGLACGQFHIQGYTLKVVEMDGVQIQPSNADTIVLCAGQTIGVVVQGKTNPMGGANYIVKMTTDMLTGNIPSESARTVIGKLIYNLLGSIIDFITDILTFNWQPASTFDDFSAKPLDGQKLLSPVDNKIELATNQTYFSGIGTRIGMGAQPWVPAKVPSLYTALTTGSNAMDPATYGVGVEPHVVKSGQVIQIHYQNTHPYPHPMHLHGHVFQIVAKGSGAWNGVESSLPNIPAKRDVAVVAANGYLVIRFKADNPGVWLFHCHIDLHLVGGMAATIIEAPDLAQGILSVPAAGISNCQKGNRLYSGNCAGDQGAISASDSASKCNTVLNSDGNNKGALIG
ncbi:hypothetical protein HBH56_100670 [Parastagonospora nodorum]|uniref:Multicopper oxidase n=1 Tax=Phaeosphaeria nodorum (strain SN15 / ATCC MYA-4574 / FGSC 10173) TaxID=321614 RepID=A0A7U2NRB1_PHANO|nr:hypothetical protein HBH56_100670 [Parastagonospora nodorum]QRD07544.1 hypothetical protein JI435_130700 [Parastagonospora nodorum SN15]KAH3930557.1 hypothetical protein HBH54_114990 [Parastagonospora nodorum]KAH4051054.1 hypothetical protein HBH49_127130 [Parastagonospora nodorum]KAH4136459.1 hypothetical protein HBH45_136140 [Parastagonospora nodorum]